jgi:hypothetical protein
LVRASSLILAGAGLASPGLRLGGTLNAISGRQADLEFDDFIPNCVSALMIGNRQQFAQAATRILRLRLIANGFCRRLLTWRWVDDWLIYGFFWVHPYIIARIIGSVPELPVTSRAMWVFSKALSSA